MTHYRLQNISNPFDPRAMIRAPFVHDGYQYATNGFYAIRQSHPSPDHDDIDINENTAARLLAAFTKPEPGNAATTLTINQLRRPKRRDQSESCPTCDDTNQVAEYNGAYIASNHFLWSVETEIDGETYASLDIGNPADSHAVISKTQFDALEFHQCPHCTGAQPYVSHSDVIDGPACMRITGPEEVGYYINPALLDNILEASIPDYHPCDIWTQEYPPLPAGYTVVLDQANDLQKPLIVTIRKDGALTHEGSIQHLQTDDEDIARKDRIRRSRVYLLDTETTGLGDDDEVLEIAIINAKGEPILNTLVKPEHKTEWKEAQAIHGITPTMVADAPTLQQLKPLLQAILHNNDRALMIYNADYDLRMLRHAINQSRPATCIMETYADYRGIHGKHAGGSKWHKLTEAAAFVGHEWQGNAHRALADCHATLSVYNHLLAHNII